MKIKLSFFSILFLLLFGSTYSVFSANDAERFDSIAQLINNYSFSQRAKSMELLEELYEIASLYPENTWWHPHYLYWHATVNSFQGINDSTIISKIEKSLNIFDREAFPHENALLLYSLALSYISAGDYGKAIKNSLEALEQFRASDNPFFIGKTLHLLGVVCYRTSNFDMAEKFYIESLPLLMPKTEYYKSLMNLYSIQIHTQVDKKSLLDSMMSTLSLIEPLSDTGLMVVAYHNTGAVYYFNQLVEEAHDYYMKALSIGETIDNSNFMTSLYLNLSVYVMYTDIFNESEKYVEARKYLEKGHDLAMSNKNQEQLSAVYLTFSDYYSKLGNTDSAYLYLLRYNRLRENLISNSKTIDAYQAYVSEFLESAQKELTIAEQAITLKNRQVAIAVILAVSIAVIAFFILLFIQQKRRQQTLIKEAEKKDLEDRLLHEKKIQQLQEEKHQEVLETKIREITSYSLLLSNKNNILQQLSFLTQQLQSADKKDVEEISRNISNLINSNLNTDSERNNFMYHFAKVHPCFFDKLKSLCNDLTENNLRMCAYFRIGMSAKQVAQILNISAETIKNSRYRLKKKLGLPEEENLDDFLRSM